MDQYHFTERTVQLLGFTEGETEIKKKGVTKVGGHLQTSPCSLPSLRGGSQASNKECRRQAGRHLPKPFGGTHLRGQSPSKSHRAGHPGVCCCSGPRSLHSGPRFPRVTHSHRSTEEHRNPSEGPLGSLQRGCRLRPQKGEAHEMISGGFLMDDLPECSRICFCHLWRATLVFHFCWS